MATVRAVSQSITLARVNDGTSFAWNMLYDTAEPMVMVGKNIINQTTRYYAWCKDEFVNFPEAFDDGVTYSVSFTVTVTDDSDATNLGTCYVQTTPFPKRHQTGVSKYSRIYPMVNRNFNLVRGSSDYAGTFTPRASEWEAFEAYSVNFRIDNVPTTTTVTISNLKIEKGTVATPWCTAQEETVGADGVSVKAMYRYYQLAVSTKGQPTAQDTYPPASPWSLSEPDYSGDSTYTLWTVDYTVFSDGTSKRGEVCKSSSYEAAKAAWNKSETASSTAQSAKDTADAASDSVMYEVPYYCVKASGETPTQPTEEYPADWSTTVDTDSFTDGGTVYKCVKKVYPNRTSDTFSWGDFTVDKVATQALQNKENARLQGQYFWHDTSGAHVGYRDSDGNYTGRTDIDSTGLSVYQSSTMVAKFGTSGGTANSQVGSSQSTNVMIGGALIQFYEAKTSLGYISNEKAYFETLHARGRLIMPGGLKAKDTPDGNIGFYL